MKSFSQSNSVSEIDETHYPVGYAQVRSCSHQTRNGLTPACHQFGKNLEFVQLSSTLNRGKMQLCDLKVSSANVQLSQQHKIQLNLPHNDQRMRYLTPNFDIVRGTVRKKIQPQNNTGR